MTGDLIRGLPWNQPLSFAHRSSLPTQESLQVTRTTVTGARKAPPWTKAPGLMPRDGYEDSLFVEAWAAL